MPYDPTLPANHSPIVSAELRNQFAGLKELIDALQEQLSPLVPGLTRVSSAEWTLQFAGPDPEVWQLWGRSTGSPAWANFGEMQSGDFPAADDVMSPDAGALWWQVKLVGVNGDGKRVTPFSNLVSFGPVP
jgi:hypothetical protein